MKSLKEEYRAVNCTDIFNCMSLHYQQINLLVFNLSVKVFWDDPTTQFWTTLVITYFLCSAIIKRNVSGPHVVFPEVLSPKQNICILSHHCLWCSVWKIC